MKTIQLEIVTPSGVVFNSPVKSVTLPGAEGEFGVLPEHASLVSLLTAGIIDIEREDGNTESVAMDWGYAKVSSDKCVVLIDTAVAIRGENDSEIGRALDAAKELLKNAQDSNVLLSAVEAKIEASARGLL